MDASAEKTLKQLEDMTEGLLRTLEQVDQIAQDFSRGDGGKQQRELFSKVESLASGLEELHEIPIAPELTVPFAVLDHIDKAENPDLYWTQVVSTTLEVRLRAVSRSVCIHQRSPSACLALVVCLLFRRACGKTKGEPKRCRA